MVGPTGRSRGARTRPLVPRDAIVEMISAQEWSSQISPPKKQSWLTRQPQFHLDVHIKSSGCCRSKTMHEDSPMRKLLTLSAAASVLAIGMSAYHAAALSPGANSVSSDGLVLKVQKTDEKGPGASGGGGKSGDSGARSQDGGGKSSTPGATQDKGDRGTQMRSGDKAARGEGAKPQQRTNVDVDVRGRRGDRARADRRTRVDVDVDRRHRTRGRDVDIGVGGYGYSSRVSCQDILRRYKQCVAR
jgi:hypothetical protein